MTSVPVPICYACIHRTIGTMTCAAYPFGIPDEIQTSEVDHRFPYTGDNGIHFEQDPTAPVPFVLEEAP